MWIYSYGSIAETGPKNNVVSHEAINLIALCGFIIIIPLISIQLWSINTDTLFIATLRLLTVIKLDIVKSVGSLVCICATCFCCTPKVLFFSTLAQPLHLNGTKNPHWTTSASVYLNPYTTNTTTPTQSVRLLKVNNLIFSILGCIVSNTRGRFVLSSLVPFVLLIGCIFLSQPQHSLIKVSSKLVYSSSLNSQSFKRLQRKQEKSVCVTLACWTLVMPSTPGSLILIVLCALHNGNHQNRN